MGIVMCGVLAGCGEQGVPVPADQFHRLVVGAPANVYARPHIAGNMEVGRFRADGVLQDRAIVFVEHDSPNVLHQYYYHLWIDSPPRLLQTVTVDYLRATHLADQVMTTGLRVVPAFTLVGDIKKLEHVVGNSSSVAVELEFSLLEHKGGSTVWVKSYTANRSVKNDSVGAATRAIGEAVGEILNSLSADLARR